LGQRARRKSLLGPPENSPEIAPRRSAIVASPASSTGGSGFDLSFNLSALTRSHLSVSPLSQSHDLTLSFGEEKRKKEEMKNREEEIERRRKKNKKKIRSNRGLLSTEKRKGQKEKKEKKRKSERDKGHVANCEWLGEIFILFKAPYYY
jgi:hypothetical protein